MAKTVIPFVSIGVDHALEQQNKLMEIVRGIRKISIDENKLEQLFAICPLISKMDDQFQGMYNMKSDKRLTVHHELVGSSKKFLTKSVKLYKTELTAYLEPGGINQDSVSVCDRKPGSGSGQFFQIRFRSNTDRIDRI